MHKSNLFKAGLMAATFTGFAAAIGPWAKASAPAKPRRKSRWQDAHALQAAEAKRARRAAVDVA